MTNFGMNKKAHHLRFLFAEQGGRCHYCQKKVKIRRSTRRTDDQATLDHVVPVAKGGTDALGNLVVACWGCNLEKGDDVYHDATENH